MERLDNWQPPHNIDAERAVLGSILLEPDVFDTVGEHLTEEDFYGSVHAEIYDCMHDIKESGEPIDVVTVSSRLQARSKLEEIGGPSYLVTLSSSTPTAANALYYANEIRKCSMQRSAIQTISGILEKAKNGETPERVAVMMDQAAAIMIDQTATSKDFQDMREVMIAAYEELEHRAINMTDGLTGIPSGFTDLDKMTAGFQRNDLIIVAARPSVGKTAFALNIAQNVGVKLNHSVAIFSLEMSASQLAQRLMSNDGNIDATRLRTGRLESTEWDKLTQSISRLSETSIFIDDTAGAAISDIRAKCRRLKKRLGKLDMVIIDYLQLITMRRPKENRQQEVSEISRTLKQIAREIEAPVIALSQLSRSVEQRQDKRPMLSDLRESGSIEQDADIVAFLYRDDYYNKDTDRKNIIEVIISKQRNGPVGTVELAFLKNYNKFVSLDHRDHTPKPPPPNKRVPDMYRVK